MRQPVQVNGQADDEWSRRRVLIEAYNSSAIVIAFSSKWSCLLLTTWGVMAALIVSGTTPCRADETVVQPTRPNIVVIVSDNQGWKDVGYHGSEIRTPVIDELAATGVRLEQFYVYPMCSPTRAAFMAGRAPSRFDINGAIGNRSRQSLPTDTVTIADTLRAAGYDTGIVGKWHLGLRPEVGPLQYGFNTSYGFLHGQIDKHSHRYKNGDRSWHRNDQFIDEQGHSVDLIADEATRFINQRRRTPFFLYVPFGAPHPPLQEEPRWVEPYAKTIKSESRRLYAAATTHMDHAVGRILAALDKTKQRDNTVVVFFSDNGAIENWPPQPKNYNGRFGPYPQLGDNGPLRGWIGDLYEGCVRTPAIIHWPSQFMPRATKEVASVLDLYPTLVEIAGGRLSPKLGLEGRNLSGFLKNNKPPQSTTLYWKSYNGQKTAVRSGDWKLVSDARGADELFDLSKDPNEQQDVSAGNRDVLQRLKTLRDKHVQLDDESETARIKGQLAKEIQTADVLSDLAATRRTYNTAASWSQRREALRQGFLEGAQLTLAPRPPIREIRHSRRVYKDYSVENVALETFPGFYCTGNLYQPVGRKDLSAAILCPHGHFRPLGRYRENHQIRCAHLARMGATVFSYSMVGWQDSTQTTHDDPSVLALQTWNSLRVVDFLTGLPRVDPKRVGITGASGGGTQAIFLSLIDDRVKASAPIVIVYPWQAHQGCLCEGGMPIMQATGTNAVELAAATSPRPQLIISVGNDPTEDFPKTGFPFIESMYDLDDARENLTHLHLPNEKHDFGHSKREAVYAFFARHLSMGPNRFEAESKHSHAAKQPLTEDLAKIKVESAEQLRVFDNAHPLPNDTLRGAAQVNAGFRQFLRTLKKAPKSTASSGPNGPKSDSSLHSKPSTNLAFAEYTPGQLTEADEAAIFTPAGFKQVGQAKTASGEKTSLLSITVKDENGKPTCCRINVVGSDGNYYQPQENHLKEFSFTGDWPQSGWGNRAGKAPSRYLGRFFYSQGKSIVAVPHGQTRIEVWKGFEHRPQSLTLDVDGPADRTHQISIALPKAASVNDAGYWSGDPHLHIQRLSDSDDQKIFDLMEAEGIHFGSVLAYNEPAGPYHGFMSRMDAPQRGTGKRTTATRGVYRIQSGQEYRSSSYGHLNLYLLDDLVLKGQSLNADDWPLYGQLGQATRDHGGVAFYAHGGYAKEVYADVVQGTVDGIELLQFGVYRGIGLLDWYHLLNSGFRVPIMGASDYPACRKLGDCKTYVHCESAEGEGAGQNVANAAPSFSDWIHGMAEGRSFVTSGPLLRLEVNGRLPGAVLKDQSHVVARVHVESPIAPVTHIQLIANGRIVKQWETPHFQRGDVIRLETTIETSASTWITARAFSTSSRGTPDAESHTNPVYVYNKERAPYVRESLDQIVMAIDGQIAFHKKRKFAEQAKVIAYFEKSRDILMQIRADGGALSTKHPSETSVTATRLDDPGRRTHTEAELKAFLKPIPPRPIEETLASFDTVGGFKMELVAREPLVNDPIAGCFDEHGNLYVCEMRDYPYKPKPGNAPIGTVRLLRDTDGDGVFDKSHVFADELLWAGGVAPWKGGVYVAAAPDIWYLKDTDGDFRADVRRKVYSGFGTGNQQAMLNNLTWGLDFRIYGSTAGNGGAVRYMDSPRRGEPEIDVNRRDFRFNPVDDHFEAITGTVQFGNAFDDWGNRFLCSESRPLLTAVLPHRYLARNRYLPVPHAIDHLTSGPVPVFRISPLERWRMIRSSRRIALGARSPDAAGASHHVIDAAAGVTIYRGDAYPDEYRGNVFIGGAQNNLIHRRTLQPNGVTFKSQRADANTEFVRSPENWFRPVNFINAPDGTLYVLDMSREVLETIHVPLDVAKHLDFTSGRDHGRIYRLAPPNFRAPKFIDMGAESTASLVNMLGSRNGWRRDTAQRLLFERQDLSAATQLKQLLRNHDSPLARLHALWCLAGLDSLADDDLTIGLQDPHLGVREHAIRLAEPRLANSSALLALVIKAAESNTIRLQFQAAFTLGESRSDEAVAALAALAARAQGDPWLRTAVLSSVSGIAHPMLVAVLDNPTFANSEGFSLVLQLMKVIGSRNQADEVDATLNTLATHPALRESTDRQERLLLELARATNGVGARLTSRNPQAATFLRHWEETAVTRCKTPGASAARLNAIELISYFPFENSQNVLADLLDIQQPEVVQKAAAESLGAFSQPAAAQTLLSFWKQASPQVRTSMLETLLARPASTVALFKAMEQDVVSPAVVEQGQRTRLLNHPDPVVKQLATKVFGSIGVGDRSQVIRTYHLALKESGNAKAGELVFRKNCMACHRVGNIGTATGPDLASSPSRDAESLLTHILDPNRYVLPKYETYSAIDVDGRVWSGMIASQTATSVTLREADKSKTLLRANVARLSATGKSLMPEQFESKIPPRAMADLIAFLQSRQKQTTPTLDIGTVPGLIEP